MKRHLNKIFLFKTPIIILGVLLLFTRCENDISKVQELTAKQDSAIVSVTDIEMTYTINAKIQIFMKAPELNRFIEADGKSYSDFPKGVYLEFYNENGIKTSSLRANYSIFHESEGLWEAFYNVEAINEKNEKLNTEYLVWNQKEERIWSDKFVTMTTQDGVIYGDGFESDQEFSSWEIVHGRGVINVDENE